MAGMNAKADPGLPNKALQRTALQRALNRGWFGVCMLALYRSTVYERRTAGELGR